MSKQNIVVHNKSSKPDNVVQDENQLIESCLAIEAQLPPFMKDYFIFLKNSVSIRTRHAYLNDILFFCKYLISETDITCAKTTNSITVEDFKKIKARDVNRFIGDYCSRYVIEKPNAKIIMENNNRALARKKSSLSSLFKFLYRDEILDKNITDGFNPIKLPKPQPDAIKKLEIDEVAIMLDAVENGTGLSEREKIYWKKTKLRDKAILILFTTYGLRLNELYQLNISSFNFNRGDFKIYRKRGKEVNMPLNKSVEKVILDYINKERPKSESIPPQHRDALFLSLQKTRMTKRAIRELVKKYTSIALSTSRENGYSPHKLRATAASSLIQYGFSIYDVQNLLDHDNVTTTQLYAAHKKNVKREIINQFEWLEEFDE
ncbi:Site-specific recombinase XerD [Caminicella sporogenes DSM 14501]|uniref:Site-specific recombinase XerD n=1 Tax=Caminicella sporogenes DSM 14501 TaxID=1121266 RepID=A0A1M6L6D2_9FIRM|nr:tyrosine-type recombinase/integrase [Caminicella sporogenes]RKD27721.1 recombinase [Caminicella sporogenes]SHJ66737.1 Site-specific recombinase XerD [Caminicella sporogenes DSM 14501]